MVALTRVATPLFGLAIFTAAALLFAIQPMVAKQLLPEYGGSSRVWLVSVFFFQAALLVGYCYAHLSYTWLGRKHIWLHLLAVVAVAWWLPIQVNSAAEQIDSPSLRLLSSLALSVGFPFVVLAATSPLLQAWWSRLKGAGQEPYFLYSASNAGSLLALMAYPFALELWLPLSSQLRWWSGCFAVFFIMLVCAAAMTLRTESTGVRPKSSTATLRRNSPTWKIRLLWVALAALPSSLLQSVTLYLSTDLAAAPLLWVIPLAIYLVSFIVAFGRYTKEPGDWQVRVTGFALIISAALLLSKTYDPAALIFVVYAVTLYLISLLSHQKLANARPLPKFLTEYYLWISLGGALGSGLNAFAAPLVFTEIWEFPIGLALAALVVAGKGAVTRTFWLYVAAPAAMVLCSFWLFGELETPTPLSRLFGIGIPLILVYVSLARRGSFGLALMLWMGASAWIYSNPNDTVLLQKRGFYGVHRVVENVELGAYDLQHGTTLHGRELKGSGTPIPSTYYHPSSPVGELLGKLDLSEWGVIGLGAGSLSAYAKPDQSLTFFELDPIVGDLALDHRYFRTLILAAQRSRVKLLLGDARLTLTGLQEHQLDILLIDAFSSDSIPLHLVTLDALDLYASKVDADGLLVFHISNQYIDLRNVLSRIALERGWQAYLGLDTVSTEQQAAEGKLASGWLAVALSPDAAQALNLNRWKRLTSPPGTPLWTDERSSLLHTINLGWMDRAAAEQFAPSD